MYKSPHLSYVAWLLKDGAFSWFVVVISGGDDSFGVFYIYNVVVIYLK